MPRLTCSVSNCAHNAGSYCSLNHIDVEGAAANCAGETCCQNFVEATGATNYTASATPTLDIACDATNCSHNCNCHCQADTVDMSGMGATNCSGTNCSSFCARQ